MRAAIFRGPRDIAVGERPDPVIQEPTDAIVRVVLACVEAVRVPLAGSTLVPVPGAGHSDQTLRSLLTLSDVMATGHHAAVSGGVRRGDVVAVVGDGAVGLSAVLAAHRLGADRIIALSRHPGRQVIAKEFGATDIVEARGDAATEAVMEMTHGIGADASLECVGTAQAIATAFALARPGSTVGMVGVPHGDVPVAQAFFRNVGWRGGPGTSPHLHSRAPG